VVAFAAATVADAFGEADFFAAATGAATDFNFVVAARFVGFFGEPMYLPWKRKSVANDGNICATARRVDSR
jgi:hypothetical protein